MDHLAKDFSVALEDFKSNRFRTKKYHSKRRNRFCSNFTQRKSSDPDSSSTASIDQNWMEIEATMPKVTAATTTATATATETIPTETVATAIGTFRHPSLIRYHSDSDEQSHSIKTKKKHQILLKNLQKPFAAANSLSSILFQRSTTKRKKKLKRLSHHHQHHHHNNHYHDHHNHHYYNHHHQPQQKQHFLTYNKQRTVNNNFRRHCHVSSSTNSANLRSNGKLSTYYSHDHDDQMNVASESSESTNWSASEGGGNDGDDELTDHNTQQDPPPPPPLPPSLLPHTHSSPILLEQSSLLSSTLSSPSSSSSSSCSSLSPLKTKTATAATAASATTSILHLNTSIGISPMPSLTETSSILSPAETVIPAVVSTTYCCRQFHSQKLTQAQKRTMIKDLIQSFATDSKTIASLLPVPAPALSLPRQSFAISKPSVDADVDNDDDDDDDDDDYDDYDDDEDRPLRRPCNELEFCLTCSLKFAEFIYYLMRTYQWWRSITIDSKTYDCFQHIRLVRNVSTSVQSRLSIGRISAANHKPRSTAAAAGGHFVNRF